MLRKFIQVTNGYVTATCQADLPEDTEPNAGLTEVSADTDLHDAVNRAFNGQTLGAKRTPVRRVIPLDDFMDRITIAEGTALRLMAQSQSLTIEQQAALAEFTARLYSR